MRINSREEEIQEAYFLWLCGIVGIGNKTKTDAKRRELALTLHKFIFYGTVANDDNRAEDGKRLRVDFASDFLKEECSCLEGQCTVLEMLVALAQRMEYNLSAPGKGDRTDQWFWEMIKNLDLIPYFEDEVDAKAKRYHNAKILDDWLERKIGKKGEGGLFPLKGHHYPDQRHTEIWYQMMNYLDENFAI